MCAIVFVLLCDPVVSRCLQHYRNPNNLSTIFAKYATIKCNTAFSEYKIFDSLTLLRVQAPQFTSSPPGVAGSVSLVSGQKVQVLETGALINTVTKAVLFHSTCVSQRQGIECLAALLCLLCE